MPPFLQVFGLDDSTFAFISTSFILGALGIVSWFIRSQYQLNLRVHDMEREIGMGENRNKDGSLRSEIDQVKRTSEDTNDKLVELREALISSGVIQAKHLKKSD